MALSQKDFPALSIKNPLNLDQFFFWH